jgi:hypothetical protein
MNCIEERAESKGFLYRFLFHFQTREICDRKCIGRIIRLGDFTESEEHLEGLLDLWFFGESVPCYTRLHLQWRIFDE